MAMVLSMLMQSPLTVPWWGWGKLLGAVALAIVLTLLLAGVPVPGVVIGLVAHVALDFSLQSDWVAREKGSRGRALGIHALIAGGIPGALVGLHHGPEMALVGVAVGFYSHYAVDWIRKFGRDDFLGVVLDQGLHILVLCLV